MNGEEYLLTQIIIAVGFCLSISVLINIFQQRHFLKVKTEHDALTEEKENLKAEMIPEAELSKLNASAEMQMLGEFWNDQLSEIWMLEKNLSKSSLTKEDIESTGLSKNINLLRQSLQFTRAHLSHVNYEIMQLKTELATQHDQTAQLKKLKDRVTSLTLREASLLKQFTAFNEALGEADKEIKRLTRENKAAERIQLAGPIEDKQTEKLRKQLANTEAQLKRTEAERALLENHYMQLDEHSGDSRQLFDELQRLKKEYEMLEQRFVDEG